MQTTCISSSASEESPTPTWSPTYDLRVGERDVVAFIDIPGVEEDDLQIEIRSAVLIVEGDRSFDHDLEDAEEYTRLGRAYGPFRVEVLLPEPVNPEEATAKYRRGVLRVRIPRRKGETTVHRVSL